MRRTQGLSHCVEKDEFALAASPCDVRLLRGRLRWYLAQAPEGQERAACGKLRRIAGSELVEDAFVLFKEQWFKRGGAWSLQPVQMYRGYFFVATADAAALDAVMSRLSYPVRLAGRQGRLFAPLEDEVCRWLVSSMDADHVLRNSSGVIEDGVLHVQTGPLRGQEGRISKIDRHHRRCYVRVSSTCGLGDSAGGGARDGVADDSVSILMPLSVPVRS